MSSTPPDRSPVREVLYNLLIVGRDIPISDQEQRWLALAIGKKLNHPLTLKTATVPLIFDVTISDEGVPDERSKKELAILKKFAAAKHPALVTLTYPHGKRKKNDGQLKNAGLLKQYLIKDEGVPAEWITLKAGGSGYRVTVTEQEIG